MLWKNKQDLGRIHREAPVEVKYIPFILMKVISCCDTISVQIIICR